MAGLDGSARYRDGRGRDIVDIAVSSVSEVGAGETKLAENSLMMVLRLATNLFVTESGRKLASEDADKIISVMECIAGVSGATLGSLKGPLGVGNRGLQVALASAALNMSVLALTSKNSLQNTAIRRILGVLGTVLTTQNDSEVVFRSLVALNSILRAQGGGNYAELAKTAGATSWLATAKDKATESRIKNAVDTISAQLH